MRIIRYWSIIDIVFCSQSGSSWYIILYLTLYRIMLFNRHRETQIVNNRMLSWRRVTTWRGYYNNINPFSSKIVVLTLRRGLSDNVWKLFQSNWSCKMLRRYIHTQRITTTKSASVVAQIKLKCQSKKHPEK